MQNRRSLTPTSWVLFWPIRYSLRQRRRSPRWPQFQNRGTERRLLRSNQHLRRAELSEIGLCHIVSPMAAGFLDRRGQSPARLEIIISSNTVARVAGVLRSGGYLSVRELMCTVSFVPKDQGFYVAMNRDEKRSRSIALPPRIVTVAGCRAIFPREPNGCTWIAVNDAGVCLALINWDRIQRNPADEIASRGQVTAILAGAASSNDIADAMMEMTLHNLRPFRLITIVPAERVMTEWRWDLELLTP